MTALQAAPLPHRDPLAYPRVLFPRERHVAFIGLRGSGRLSIAALTHQTRIRGARPCAPSGTKTRCQGPKEASECQVQSHGDTQGQAVALTNHGAGVTPEPRSVRVQNVRSPGLPAAADGHTDTGDPCPAHEALCVQVVRSNARGLSHLLTV